jgi:phage antirepressor YoqD-like protein
MFVRSRDNGSRLFKNTAALMRMRDLEFFWFLYDEQ